MFSSQTFKEILGVLSSLATILGVPIGLFMFYHQHRADARRRRAEAEYIGMTDQWNAVLTTALQYPDVNVLALPAEEFAGLEDRERRQLILYSMLMTMVGRAFLMYKDEPRPLRENRMAGWDGYIVDLSRGPDFAQFWRLLGHTFDRDFVAHVNGVLTKSGVSDRAKQTPNRKPKGGRHL